MTLGDHVYRRKEIYSVLESEPNIVKPANLPAESVGREGILEVLDPVFGIACEFGGVNAIRRS